MLPPPPPEGAGFGAGLLAGAGADLTGAAAGVEARGVDRVLVDDGVLAAAKALAALARARATRARCAFRSLSATNLCWFSLIAACCKERARSNFLETAGDAAAAGLLDSVLRPSLKAK